VKAPLKIRLIATINKYCNYVSVEFLTKARMRRWKKERLRYENWLQALITLSHYAYCVYAMLISANRKINSRWQDNSRGSLSNSNLEGNAFCLAVDFNGQERRLKRERRMYCNQMASCGHLHILLSSPFFLSWWSMYIYIVQIVI